MTSFSSQITHPIISVIRITHPNISIIDYLKSSVWVRLGNTKYGVGVIALRDIPKNTKVTDYDICKSPDNLCIKIFRVNHDDFMKDIAKLHPNIQNLIKDRYILVAGSKEKGNVISPNSQQIYRFYVNHSDKPNVDNNLVSIKDINEGDEITFSYKDILIKDAHIVSKKYYNYVA